MLPPHRLESELAGERSRLSELTARLQIAEYEMERYDVTSREAAETADRLRKENSALTERLKVRHSMKENPQFQLKVVSQNWLPPLYNVPAPPLLDVPWNACAYAFQIPV